MTHTIPHFSSTQWDTVSKKQRDMLITDLMKQQIAYGKAHVPFYTKFHATVSLHDLNDMKDCASHVPALTKDHIRALNSPYDLLPHPTRQRMNTLYLHRGTGGTTGPPTSVFYSFGDWNAVMDGNSRLYHSIKPVNKPLIAFNGYNQGHISGPYFDSVVRRLGAMCVSRNFGCNDEQAVRQMALHKANLVIAPAVTTHKGGAFENLLDADSRLGLNYLNGDHIDTLLCSSTGITKELYEEVKALGIKNVINMYGSTDVGAVCNSPPTNPFELRLNFGHNSVFVVDGKQHHVNNGERGMLVSSRIGSYDEEGNIIPNQGTQLINFHLGDEVTYHEHCSDPNLTLPWINNVKRIMNLKEKFEAGCERW